MVFLTESGSSVVPLSVMSLVYGDVDENVNRVYRFTGSGIGSCQKGGTSPSGFSDLKHCLIQQTLGFFGNTFIRSNLHCF